MSAVPRRPSLTHDDLIAALRKRGGRARLRDLAPELGVHRDTLRRHFRQLVADGLVEPAGRGEYQLARRHLGLSEDALRLAEVLQTSNLDAHLTGFDILAPYAHQFVFQIPHVVYAAPTAVDSVEFELTANDYVVRRAEGGASVSTPDSSKLVVLRKQPDPERHRVHGYVAPVEKAWVDALREAHRGKVPLQFMELGRILRSLIDGGADVRFLRRYARQLGYLDRVDAAMNKNDGHTAPQLQALRAGYVA